MCFACVFVCRYNLWLMSHRCHMPFKFPVFFKAAVFLFTPFVICLTISRCVLFLIEQDVDSLDSRVKQGVYQGVFQGVSNL